VHLILASASPRRADLLRAAGYTFEVCVPDVDESVLEKLPGLRRAAGDRQGHARDLPGFRQRCARG
jgi:predicted house-cleaning NTP pyrophosphatase (Maf/HAM1 superfamily)